MSTEHEEKEKLYKQANELREAVREIDWALLGKRLGKILTLLAIGGACYSLHRSGYRKGELKGLKDGLAVNPNSQYSYGTGFSDGFNDGFEAGKYEGQFAAKQPTTEGA